MHLLRSVAYVMVISDFRQRTAEKLEDLGDNAAAAQRYDEPISLYTTALSLKPRFPQGILMKRNKIYMTVGSWEQALDDANQVQHFVTGRSIPLMHHYQMIKLDPTSPWGYERRHAALHATGDYDSAINAFQEMLLKMEQSPDPDVRREFVLVVMVKTIIC